MAFWTTSELSALRANAHLGVDDVARLLDRTPASVRMAAGRNRISLRRKGERRGTVLGQPRGMRLRDILPDGVDRKTAELILARQQIDRDAELCPSCGRRPAAIKTTGFCLPCHKRHLASIHRDILAEEEATRELWQTRQALKRSRDRATA